MAAARIAVRGLSPDELQSIRDTLAAGRRPRVRFTESAGQVAGQTGQVVGLTDPTVSDEWVVVRFDGDELPFSPTDLSIPSRGMSRRADPKPSSTAESAPKPEPKAASGPAAEAESRVARAAVPAARAAAAAATAPDAPTATGAPGAPAGPSPADPAPARRATRSTRPKAPAGLTVTLSYAEGEWTLAATQGSKSVAKPYPVRPAEALKMVALIDVPMVREAVEQIMAAERSAAQQEAEALRAKLAAIEARLAELHAVG
jgi:hypothetical protein